MCKLTKKEALEKTVHMWRWIAEECEKRKRAINTDEYFKYFNTPISKCYLCEYRSQYKVGTCLIDKWNPEDNDCRSACCKYEFGNYCESYDDGDYQNCAKAANAIVDLAEMELKKL